MSEKKKYTLSPEAKARQLAYIERYKNEHYRFISFKCRLDTDKDILDILDASPNKSAVIKEAIREWIVKHGE